MAVSEGIADDESPALVVVVMPICQYLVGEVGKHSRLGIRIS